MRILLAFVFAVCLLLGSGADVFAASTSLAYTSCSDAEIGVTKLDNDNANIVACLRYNPPTNTTPVWKIMTKPHRNVFRKLNEQTHTLSDGTMSYDLTPKASHVLIQASCSAQGSNDRQQLKVRFNNQAGFDFRTSACQINGVNDDTARTVSSMMLPIPFGASKIEVQSINNGDSETGTISITDLQQDE